MNSFNTANEALAFIEKNRTKILKKEKQIYDEQRTEEIRKTLRTKEEQLQYETESEKENLEDMETNLQTLLASGYTKGYLVEKLSITPQEYELFFRGYDSYKKNIEEGRITDKALFGKLHIRVSILYSDFLFKKHKLSQKYRFCYLAECPKTPTKNNCTDYESCNSWKKIMLEMSEKDKEGFKKTYNIN